MRVHLRLTEKDVDLCRWRRSLNSRMITYYISQILNAEIQGEIAYLPTMIKHSVKSDPCEVYMNFKDPVVVGFLASLSPHRRNATLKKIIRKHLQAQNGHVIKTVFQDSTDIQTDKAQSIPDKKSRPPKAETYSKPEQAESRKDIIESEEDRAAILALIAMGGE